jgi:hypothetical protein
VTWDGSASRFTDEQYAKSCVLDRGPDAGPPKQRYSLPVRDPDGTLNCDGVSAARAMVGKVKASPELIAAARAKLEKLASQCASNRSRPEPGEVEERSAAELTVEDRKLRGVVPYGVESADLGGWKEIIERHALRDTDFSDLVVRVDHAGIPLGRYPGTLSLEDRDDGLHWSCEPPASRQDVLEAVDRGDLQHGSWRMVVARDRWDGDVRHVEEIRALKDVSVVVSPAYPAAVTELRSQPEPEQEAPVPDEPEAGTEPEEQATPRPGGLTVEARNANPDASVEDRVMSAMRGTPKGESRSLTTSTAAEVTPPDLQTFLWDLLRDNSVVLQSGVRLFTTSRKTVTWPQLTADMQADFYSELDEFVATDLAFDEFEMTPVKIAAMARGSSEVFDDSDPSLLQVVTSNLGTILGLKFDAQCLAGDVTTTPKGFDGMLKIAGQTIAVGGALTNYDPFIEAMGALAEQHIPGPYAVVTHPRVTTALDLIKQYTAGQSNVGLPRPVGFPPMYVTSQIGLTTGASPTTSALVYAPRFVTVLRRMDTTIVVDRSAELTTDAVLVVGRVRATLGSPHTNAIVALTGIDAPPIGGVTVSGTSAGPQTAQTKAATTTAKK